MRNNKGQTLVEFVIIMPIFLLLIISFLDISKIIFAKTQLNNALDTVYDMYTDSNYTKIKSYIEEKNIKINYTTSEEITVIELSDDVNITSPILIPIFGKKYKLTVQKDYYKSLKG